MSPPSYTRATASSTLKSSLQQSKAKIIGSPQSTSKRLKRPSTLTAQDRGVISYNADLIPIKPRDPMKPCPLANLPSEIRTSIYEWVLYLHPGFIEPKLTQNLQTTKPCYLWPRILHVSRAIRVEAAYVYYSSTRFTFQIRDFDFSNVRLWLAQMPLRHRALLTRNQNLTLRILVVVRDRHPRPGWLSHISLEQQWKNCSQFGNLYALSSDPDRIKFTLFCRLQSWFHFNSGHPYINMRWHYVFDTSHDSLWRFIPYSTGDLYDFLQHNVGVLGMKRIAKTWTRERGEGKGKEEAMLFLKDMDDYFLKLSSERRRAFQKYRIEDNIQDVEELKVNWAREMKRLARLIGGW
ncbi:hypothetical protein GQ44DRAFT_646766 [Phaeosphaeriaceae sp. PMI808]|nr:hypothetical protein GQ44DRAFT_646766 [Phaeosphaeriaceae sp. PMI808]